MWPCSGSGLDFATNVTLHINVLAATSTIARFAVAILSDIFAPRDSSQELTHLENSRVITISRIAFLVFASFLLLLGFTLLSLSDLFQPISGCHTNSTFLVVTSLVGIGYGSVFTLVPTIIGVVWGVENFGTHWGIIATSSSLGVTLWSLFYARIYDGAHGSGGTAVTCSLGWRCYGPWAISGTVGVLLAIISWITAWTRKGGWRQRNIPV